MSESAKKGAQKGSVALAASFLLAVSALGTAAAALLVDEGATMALLAAGACVAFASLVLAFVSLRGPRFAPSAAAIVASLCILAGVGVAFAVVSFSRFVAAVERETEEARAVVDEDYQFRLAPPSAENLYDRDSARTLHERSLAGAYLADGVTVLVFVEPSYGLPLADAALAELHDAVGEATTSESPPAPTTFLGRDAVRIHRQDGMTFSECTFVERDGWMYFLDAYHERESAPETDVWFPAALEGFALLDGEVDADTAPLAPPFLQGPGYEVRAGTFESTWWGVRLSGDGSAPLVIEAQTPGADRGAIAGLSRRRPDVHLTITPLATGGRDPRVVESELVDGLATTATRLEEPAVSHPIGARNVDFAAWRWESGRTREARVGFVSEGERLFEILIWSPSRALTDAQAGPLLTHLEILDDARMLELRNELVDGPWRGSGESSFVRDDALHFLHEAVSWQRPDARWRASAVASDDPDGDLAFLDAPTLGVRGCITSWQAAATPADTHEEWVSVYVEGVPPEQLHIEVRGEPATFGAAEGFVSSGIDPGSGYMYAIATTQVDDVAYGVELWASPRDAAANADAIRAGLLGLRVVVDPPTVGFDADGAWHDPRFGVTFRPPSRLSNVQRELTSLPTGPGSLLEVARGANIVGLVATPRDWRTSAEQQADHLVRAHFATLLEVDGHWEERQGTLGDLPCAIRDKPLPFGLGGLTVYRIEREGALVVLLVNRVGRDLDLGAVTAGVTFDP
jgi:hypothetical protein